MSQAADKHGCISHTLEEKTTICTICNFKWSGEAGGASRLKSAVTTLIYTHTHTQGVVTHPQQFIITACGDEPCGCATVSAQWWERFKGG